MIVENAIPADDIEVRVEDDTANEVKADVGGDGEETPKNEESDQRGEGSKRSAGSVIADLGNEKKQIAEKLVTLAKSSEDARQQVKSMLISDPSTASYLKKKFGDEYDLIVGDEEVDNKNKLDLDAIREQEKTKAQAEVIKEQMQINHEHMLTEKAQEYGFTSDEFEIYKKKVDLLGGDEQALKDAALIVNQAKAMATKGDYIPAGGEAEKPRRTITITPGLNDFSKGMQVDQKQFASEIGRVKALHTIGLDGKPVMELPGL